MIHTVANISKKAPESQEVSNFYIEQKKVFCSATVIEFNKNYNATMLFCNSLSLKSAKYKIK